jgi:imidazolonepropionase-like amidohydrolase
VNAIELQDVRIVDVAAGRTGETVTLRLVDGRITAIEPSPVRGAPRFVVPGLIDTHVHLFFDGGADPVGSYRKASEAERLAVARRNAGRALAAGITTVRDLGGPTQPVTALARRIALGELAGPRLVVAGAPITRMGGHCHFFGGEVAGPAEARRLVDAHAEAGAQVVKVMVSGGGLTPGTRPDRVELPGAVLTAAVEAGHANGLPVTAHCHARAAIEVALDAGVDMIEHASFVEPDGRVSIADDLVSRLRSDRVAVGPTVVGALRTAARYRSTGRMADPHDRATVERLEARQRIAGALREAGVTILAGTDGGVTDTPTDVLVDELEAYRAVGFSTAQALRSATMDAARGLRLVRTGEVRVDWAADLLLVAADPLEDLAALRSPLAVIQAGRVVAGDPGPQGASSATTR